MRVSNKAIYDTVNHNLARASDAMLKANKVVSTGKRINRLSDDPVGLVSVLSLRSSIEYVGQLERNITTGRSWLNMGETAMSQMEDILSQAKALAIQMSSDNQGAEERANSAEAVEGYFQQILSLANTEVDGRYIFAGTHTAPPPVSSLANAFHLSTSTFFPSGESTQRDIANPSPSACRMSNGSNSRPEFS